MAAVCRSALILVKDNGRGTWMCIRMTGFSGLRRCCTRGVQRTRSRRKCRAQRVATASLYVKTRLIVRGRARTANAPLQLP